MSSNARQLKDSSVMIEEVSKIVTQITGVQLGARQSHMVGNRVRTRFAQLGLKTDEEYLAYLRKNHKTESAALVSLLTTHHTYFFREFTHFEFLETTALVALIAIKRKTSDRCIRVWSAACSRGQEVYSLAMFLNWYLAKHAREFTFEILGTDVDPESVDIAKNGVYHHKEINEVPIHFLSGNWAKGSGDISQYVKAKESIRKQCSFKAVNLLNIDLPKERPKFDVIFCRNVFIYFTLDQVKAISTQMLNHLSPDGFLFLGISESLNGLQLPTSVVGPSIYRHAQAKTNSSVVTADAVKPKSSTSVAKPLRVLCVDDSALILSILKKILTPEFGFEVVGTALNGIEAASRVTELKPDVVTLDIHMPEQNGLEYLRARMSPSHPPVVMISSVSRDEADLALKCLEAGATDYVEKPALANLDERGHEIRLKLKYALEVSQTSKGTARQNLELERSFAKSLLPIQNADKKLRLISATLADRDRLGKLLKELSGVQPPTFVVMEGAGAGLASLKAALQASLAPLHVVTVDELLAPELKVNTVYLCDAHLFFKTYQANRFSVVSALILGYTSGWLSERFHEWKPQHLLIEDRTNSNQPHPLKDIATDTFPVTSFAYHSHEFLGKKP